METFKLSRKELRNLAVGTAVTAISYITFANEYSTSFVLWTIVFAGIVLSVRDLGQRITARMMEGEVETKLSTPGSAVSLLFATVAWSTSTSLIALFPVFSEFSGKRYEQWGKGVDAIWMKREFWMVSTGILSLTLLTMISITAGLYHLAGISVLFTLFQLLPFDQKNIPTGSLDGATILRYRGLHWIVWMIVNIGLATTLFL